MLPNRKNFMQVRYAYHAEYQNNVYLHNLTENVQKAVIFLLICHLGRSYWLGCKKDSLKF